LEILVCRLIEALRAELLHSGEMLALANEWKSGVEAAAAASVEQIELALDDAFQALQAARAWRTTCQLRVRKELQTSATLPFSQIIARLPAKYQALVASLEHENERLVGAHLGRASPKPFAFEPIPATLANPAHAAWAGPVFRAQPIPPAQRRDDATRPGESS
jgi:hypothetical protein